MGNYLKVPDRQRIAALLDLGWGYRRIERETGVRRETIARYDPRRWPKRANSTAGSGEPVAAQGDEEEQKRPNPTAGSAMIVPNPIPGPPSACEPFRAEIEALVDKGLTAQRIWQDLCAEHGFSHGYESVKRFVRVLRGRRPEVADVMEHPPGKEAQVDYFKSPAPVFNEATGKWGRPWIFRMTLCCSRHGYEEPMWGQQRNGFLRAHESAIGQTAFGFFPLLGGNQQLQVHTLKERATALS